MNPQFRFVLHILAATLFVSSCSPPPTQEPTLPSVPASPATLTVTAESLVGDWARVLTSNRNPDRTAHYWLRLGPDGIFALTTNKMQFETNVNHKGAYSLDGDRLTLSAQAGSLECEGESATYQATMYEDGSLEFRPIDVPCEQWLNIGPGGLGEGTIWVRLGE